MIGVVSDTHGLLRPEVREALGEAELILHAGDVGDQSVLQELQLIAPVVAVRGNMDRAGSGGGTGALPLTRTIRLGCHLVYLLHDLGTLDLDPAAAGIAAVVYGHSHRPSVAWRNGLLFLNPGSAGPRRFNLPVCVATLDVSGERLEPRLVELRVGSTGHEASG